MITTKFLFSLLLLTLFTVACTSQLQQDYQALSRELNETKEALNETQTNLETSEQAVKDLQENLNTTNHFNRNYNKATLTFQSGLANRDVGGRNQELWSWAYDNYYFSLSIDYCVAARDVYSFSNSEFQKARTYFIEANESASAEYQELIGSYVAASDLAIEINWALYQACQYYEAASSAYVQEDYAAGDVSLISGNKKIGLHDELIMPYNRLISKIDIQEENLE